MNFKCVGFWNWCMCLFIYEQHPCVHAFVYYQLRWNAAWKVRSPPRLLSPRRVCKQTRRGKLCMRTGFRQSYLFYVNTFSIRNQLCVFVTLCAHAPASPRRSYLLECVQMWCCWWSAAFAEQQQQQQQQCWSVCRAGGGLDPTCSATRI